MHVVADRVRGLRPSMHQWLHGPGCSCWTHLDPGRHFSRVSCLCFCALCCRCSVALERCGIRRATDLLRSLSPSLSLPAAPTTPCSTTATRAWALLRLHSLLHCFVHEEWRLHSATVWLFHDCRVVLCRMSLSLRLKCKQMHVFQQFSLYFRSLLAVHALSCCACLLLF